MNKYAQAAVESAKLCSNSKVQSPRAAWDKVTADLFGLGTASQEKGCPRDAFLGLCEEGRVKGIPRGNYCHSVKNKQYALDALDYIQKNPSLSNQPIRLWELVLQGKSKAYNSQMDVVIALWTAGLIVLEPAKIRSQMK